MLKRRVMKFDASVASLKGYVQTHRIGIALVGALLLLPTFILKEEVDEGPVQVTAAIESAKGDLNRRLDLLVLEDHILEVSKKVRT